MAGVAPADPGNTGGEAIRGLLGPPSIASRVARSWRGRGPADVQSRTSMLILSLDTTSRTGSAAGVQDGRVLAETLGDPARTHGERLPGDLMRALAEAGVALRQVGLFAVAAGPGSFTGLRV